MERVMSAAEVAAVARAAGLPEAHIPLAVAIAFHESSFRPGAVGDVDNPKPGCRSIGLWQINSCPSRDGSGHPRHGDNQEALKDPLTNAKAMATISGNGSTWKPWAALPKALATLDAGTLDIGSTATPKTPGAVQQYLPTSTEPFDITGAGTWARVGNGIGGAALIVLAYYILKTDLATGGII